MGACACVYVGDTSCGREFYQQQDRTARKEHACYECGEKILPGEQYSYHVGRWDGQFEAYKICSTCQEIIDAFFCDGMFFGEVLGNLHDHILEMNGEISGECLSPLSPKAREVVCGMIEDYWEENPDDDE